MLFEGGRREHRTASWLVAVAGRTEFRSRIGELLLASGGPYGGSYCITVATFGTSADADLVCSYLDRYLPQPDLVWDQTSERASRYLAAGGLWQQWTDATSNMVRDPQDYRQVVDRLCSFACECAELFARMEARRRSSRPDRWTPTASDPSVESGQ
ncbi:DUF6000 family protein [Streptomyces sp. NPDC059491]|uniref:DUF6000 family protein n=1 Tax=Streptomyces sp. NPDC059491 TaxID=3346850 RepID=UPI00369F7364